MAAQIVILLKSGLKKQTKNKQKQKKTSMWKKLGENKNTHAYQTKEILLV